MKLSVSLPDEDVVILDEFIRRSGLASRSAGVHRAIGLLRHPDLEADYATAWAEWAESDEADLWDRAAGDGLGGSPQ